MFARQDVANELDKKLFRTRKRLLLTAYLIVLLCRISYSIIEAQLPFRKTSTCKEFKKNLKEFEVKHKQARGSGAIKRPIVTFSGLGHQGRLGNQLFQIAATIGIAEAHGYPWDFLEDISMCAAGRLFNLCGGLNRSRPFAIYKEGSEVYHKINLTELQNHEVISLSGYFQDYQYFHQSLVSLSMYLDFPYSLINKVRSRVPELDSFSVALHVRRGDYENLNALYNLLNEDYYLRALSLIDESIDNVIIVSDDVSWCMKHLAPRIPYNIIFSQFKDDDLSDFLLLHLSKVIIIANSSFSWWAAFLKYVRSDLKMFDTNVRVFAPAEWYNSSGALAYLNRDSFLPPLWTRVPI